MATHGPKIASGRRGPKRLDGSLRGLHSCIGTFREHNGETPSAVGGAHVLHISRERPLGCRAAQAVEFGVEIGEYQGVVRVPRRVFQRLLPEGPTPERCVEAYYLQRTRFESIAERKLRQRQLTEDGNVEITGRDLRESPAAAAEGCDNGDQGWTRAWSSMLTHVRGVQGFSG
jgi:hypothetical protein